MEKELTLGSLFDGSGGFPLGGLLSGITPVWASEIEPFPIRVTTKRLPQVKHLGDISKINGASIEPVDIITFGSPCTDMSIAGKRAGLDGKQSVLFYQAIRIIKEMRCETNGKYPRFIVWENVPGVFSSNKGEDFRAVLEEICKVKEEQFSVPRCNKWCSSGEIVGEEFSLAWRVLDAQYWGVPQRRKRIYLVADFANRCAGKILFESEGLSGYSAENFRAWQEATRNIKECIGEAGINRWLFENHSQDSRFVGPLEKAQTVSATFGTGGNNQPLIVERLFMQNSSGNNYDRKAGITEEDVSSTLDTSGSGAIIGSIYSASKGTFFTHAEENVANTLMATDYKEPPLVNQEICSGEQSEYIVRRLTPTECARLQGFPDWWCAGLETVEPTVEEIGWWREIFETYRNITGTSTKTKTDRQIIKWLHDPYSDSAEYKMWGNGVSLPNVVFVLSGIGYFA